MAATLVSNVLNAIPENWTSELLEASVTMSKIFGTNVVVRDERLNKTVDGNITNVPYIAEKEVVPGLQDDTSDTTITNGTAEKMLAWIMRKDFGVGQSSLSRIMSGVDVVGAMASKFGEYWGKEHDRDILNILAGSFGVAGLASNISDITAAADPNFSAETFIDAESLIDGMDENKGVYIVHPKEYGQIKKLNLIDFEKDAETGEMIARYQGYVLVQASYQKALLENGTDYTSYIIGANAFGYGEQAEEFPLEADRNAARNSNLVYSRKSYYIHPYGMSFTGTPASTSGPATAELANAANWTLEFDAQNVKMIKFIKKLG